MPRNTTPKSHLQCLLLIHHNFLFLSKEKFRNLLENLSKLMGRLPEIYEGTWDKKKLLGTLIFSVGSTQRGKNWLGTHFTGLVTQGCALRKQMWQQPCVYCFFKTRALSWRIRNSFSAYDTSLINPPSTTFWVILALFPMKSFHFQQSLPKQFFPGLQLKTL